MSMAPSPQTNIVDRIILRASALFGSNSKEAERFIKFFVVGIIGAIVDFSTLNILQTTVLVPAEPNQRLKIAIATGIAFSAAVFSNFIWNRYWTYPDSRSKGIFSQLFIFYGINSAALVFRLIFVSFTFHFFGELGEQIITELGLADSMSSEAVSQLGTNISGALAVITAMFWNFGVNRLWTYNDVSHDGQD